MKETNKSQSEADNDNYEVINKLINVNEEIVNQNVVSHYIITFYNSNIIHELSTNDFLENLKESYKYFLELLNAINELNYMALKLPKNENKLFFETLEKLHINATNDKNKLTTICKRFCMLSIPTRAKSDILIKVQETIKKNKQDFIAPSELKDLFETEKYFDINKYVIKSYNKSSISDCTSNIKRCCTFYTQLIKSISNVVYFLSVNQSNQNKRIKHYLNKITENLDEDYNCLKEIEDNLISLYYNSSRTGNRFKSLS